MHLPAPDPNRRSRLTADEVPLDDKHNDESRHQRVAAIKAEVEAGTYALDSFEVSRSIIDWHLRKRETD